MMQVLKDGDHIHQLFHGDYLDVLQDIPAGSVDMIFADLPYGTTHNDWDKQIPLEDHVMINGEAISRDCFLLAQYRAGVPYATAMAKFREQKRPGLWSHYLRIIKDNGCIALFAQAPFDTELSATGKKWFRYEWIIKKTRATGHLNAKKMPMKAHEKILIFYKKPPRYYPQMTEGHPPVHSYTQKGDTSPIYKTTKEIHGGGSTERYPVDVLTFKWDTRTSALHPNQKPVESLKYFIRTYTAPGDTVMDNCMGSGSAGVACVHTDRQFIGIEKSNRIYSGAVSRIQNEIRAKEEGGYTNVERNHSFIQCKFEGI